LSSLYLESVEPMVEVGYTLLGEGGFLMKYPAKVQTVMERIIEINVRFNKWDQAVPNSDERGKENEENQGDSE
jgi:hypothetical protein